MRAPLHVGDIPRPSLRQKTRDFKRRFQINDEQAAASILWLVSRHLCIPIVVRSKDKVSRGWANANLHARSAIPHQVDAGRSLTLPTASPTSVFMSIWRLWPKCAPSSAEDGASTSTWSSSKAELSVSLRSSTGSRSGLDAGGDLSKPCLSGTAGMRA